MRIDMFLKVIGLFYFQREPAVLPVAAQLTPAVR
jgi:hypothetical protein